MRTTFLTIICILLCFSTVACGGSKQEPSSTGFPSLTPFATESPATSSSATPVQTPTATPNKEVAYQPQGEANYTVTLDPNVEYWDYPVSKVGHVFTHSLISYLDMTDLDTNVNCFWRDVCITVNEFNRFLESVYEKDYILINMNYIYEYREDEDGVLKAYLKDTIKLPKGKKGLIISVDDLTFDPSQHLQGRVDKLTIYQGKLASATVMKDGTVDYAYDKEVAPIVEQFCLKHPDFSFAGAKCMLAVNGRCGVLGYRTSPRYEGKLDYTGKVISVEAEQAAAREVIAYLKDNGFYFGCHGIAHVDIKTLSGASLDREFDIWNEEVKPLIGYTPIYVYPLGAWSKYGTEQHNRLLSEGYHVFCATYVAEYLIDGMPDAKGVGNIYTERCVLQGDTLHKYADVGKENNTWFWKYFDPYEVYDFEARAHCGDSECNFCKIDT